MAAVGAVLVVIVFPGEEANTGLRGSLKLKKCLLECNPRRIFFPAVEKF
jgi:hypothetical protein